MIKGQNAADTLTSDVDRLSFDGSLKRSVDVLNAVTIVGSILAGDGCSIVNDDRSIAEALRCQREVGGGRRWEEERRGDERVWCRRSGLGCRRVHRSRCGASG